VLAGTALGPYGDTSMVLKIVPVQTQFSVELSGSSAGTDSPSTEQTLFKLSPAGDLISYQLNIQDIENVTMAHIHIACRYLQQPLENRTSTKMIQYKTSK